MEMYFTVSAECVRGETEGNQKNLSWATFKEGVGYCVVLQNMKLEFM